MTYTVNTGTIEVDAMVNAFLEEEKHIDNEQSTMMGSEIYINLVKYVKKICHENNFVAINQNDDEEGIIHQLRTQFEYDFNTIERAEGFLMEENIKYYNIVWLENAYEYHKWGCGFGCVNEAKLESKVNFMMFCIAQKTCTDWIEKEELDIDLW